MYIYIFYPYKTCQLYKYVFLVDKYAEIILTKIKSLDIRNCVIFNIPQSLVRTTKQNTLLLYIKLYSELVLRNNKEC